MIAEVGDHALGRSGQRLVNGLRDRIHADGGGPRRTFGTGWSRAPGFGGDPQACADSARVYAVRAVPGLSDGACAHYRATAHADVRIVSADSSTRLAERRCRRPSAGPTPEPGSDNRSLEESDSRGSSTRDPEIILKTQTPPTQRLLADRGAAAGPRAVLANRALRRKARGAVTARCPRRRGCAGVRRCAHRGPAGTGPGTSMARRYWSGL